MKTAEDFYLYYHRELKEDNRYYTIPEIMKLYAQESIKEDRKYLMSELGGELWNIDLLNEKEFPI